MTPSHSSELVLALHPFTRGVAFALFEGPLSPVDWGTGDVRGGEKNARAFDFAKRLIEKWRPDVVVLADCSGVYGRAQRIQRLSCLIRSHAEELAIEIRIFTRAAIRECFKTIGASTRYEIAQAIASRIVGLSDRLPPAPKPWENHHERITVFDAAALVMTFHSHNGHRLDAPISIQGTFDGEGMPGQE